MKKYPRIIFMGNMDFSIYSLQKIFDNKFNIVGVVTTKDKKNKKNQKIYNFLIKKYSILNNFKIMLPKEIENFSFIENLKNLYPDIIIIVAFRIIPKIIWSIPKLGTFNLHPSLLPNYRGAAPIQWAIINGEKETGITTFLINENIDSGKILLQEKIYINSDETFGSLYKKLGKLGANLVIKTINGIITNTIKPKSQIINNKLKIAPKIFFQDRKISWLDPIKKIYNKIRGLYPYPGAWTKLINKSGEKILFKIYKINYCYYLHNKPIGTLIIKNKEIKIFLIDGNISIIEGQLEGRKRMNVSEIINGLREKDSLKLMI